ncbi:MAG: NAD(P)H-dependent glycerol-3-phosphate dehydrogenase, partial [Candidatus Poribacteria bacterium]
DQERINSEYLPNVKIPSTVDISSSLNDAINKADILIIAVPSQYVRKTLREMKPYIEKEAIICSASKGIELETFRRMSEVIYEETNIPKRNIAVLSGPSHAEEVSVGKATTVVSASSSESTARYVQETLNTQSFRIYTSKDVKGVEYGGALKNIIAIGAGICDGLKKKGGMTNIGDNAKASLLTRGIEEMARLGVSLGSNKRTFYGLTGWGDLLVTSYSSYGRNRLVGECLAMGMTLDEIKSEKLHGMVPEGVETTKAVYELSKIIKVEMPITEQIYLILYEGKNIESAVYDLMTRSLKPEHGYYIKGIPKRVKLAFRK